LKDNSIFFLSTLGFYSKSGNYEIQLQENLPTAKFLLHVNS